MIAHADDESSKIGRELWKEADELNRIFGSIARKTS